MPPPRNIRPLPLIQNLPLACALLAEFYVRHPKSSPDYLLLLADACDELGALLTQNGEARQARAVRALGLELRRRAPDYA